MAGKKVPDRLINFNAYLNGGTLLGLSDVELPTITYLSETLSGAGIGGEIETPLLGMTESMETSINWRTITKNAVQLAAPGAHAVDFRGSQQILDTATGKYVTEAVRASMKLMCKEFSVGKFEPNATTDTANTFTVTRYELYIGGKRYILIDQLTGEHEINGVDYSASYRKDIGMI